MSFIVEVSFGQYKKASQRHSRLKKKVVIGEGEGERVPGSFKDLLRILR